MRTVRAKLKSGEYREVGKGKIDVVQALEAQRHGRQAPAVSMETARLRGAQAEKVETENAILHGKLLTRELVDELSAHLMAVIARMLGALDRRLPPLVVGQDLTTTRIKIREEVNAVRQAAADELTALATPRKNP